MNDEVSEEEKKLSEKKIHPEENQSEVMEISEKSKNEKKKSEKNGCIFSGDHFLFNRERDKEHASILDSVDKKTGIIKVKIDKKDKMESENYLKKTVKSMWERRYVEEKKAYKYDVENKRMKIKHKGFPDGIEINYKTLKNKAKPKALLFALHGYGCCADLEVGYFASHFGDFSIDIVGFDQERHGGTCTKENLTKVEREVVENGKKKIIKRMLPDCVLSNYENMILNSLNFFEIFLEKENERYKDIPVFVWGLSMGGVTSLALGEYLKINEKLWEKSKIVKQLKGIIAYCPSIEMISKPSMIMMAVVKMVAYWSPKKLVPPPKGGGRCSRVDCTAGIFDNHDLCYNGGISFQTVKVLCEIGDFVRTNSKAFTFPLLFVQSKEDNRVKLEPAKSFFKSCSSKDKKFLMLEEGLHAIQADFGAKKGLDLTIKWILRRVT